MEKKEIENRIYKGIVLIILSSLCFAVMTLFVKCAGDLPAVQKSFFRNLVSFFFAGVMLLKNKEDFRMPKASVPDLLLRAIFGTAAVLMYFYAVDHLVLSDATALNKMSPFFTILFSYLILKEKITKFQAFAVLAAFAGSMFVVKPSFSNISLFPATLGLLSGILAGIAYVMVRKLSERGVNSRFVVFFFSAFSCVVLLPFLIFDYHPMGLDQLGFLLLAGLFAGGGQFAVTAAYFNAPARDISLYSFSEIIFSSVLGLLVFGQLPDHWSMFGYLVIFAMAALVYLHKDHRIYPLAGKE